MDIQTDWAPSLAAAQRPLYLALVDRLASDIRERRLFPGDRLPTHRDLAHRLHIDVSTVSRAYAEARRRGLVAGHVGRGTYVRGLRGRRTDGPPSVIDLTTNVPPGDALVERTVTRVLAAINARGSSSSSGYAPVGGAPEDRAAAAEWLAHHGLSVRGDRVLVAACAQQAFVAILSAHCEPGDVVLTEAITYPGFFAAARLLRLDVVSVQSDHAGVDPVSVESLCRRRRPKMLILGATLQNPTGVTLSTGRRTRLAAVARRHGLLILEDDAYGPLHQKPPRPIADIAPDVTYLVATTSKVLMPMMRWCAIAAPTPALADRVEASLRAIGWMHSALETAIARAVLASRDAASILAARRREADGRVAIAARVLGTPAISATARGHHLWLGLPQRWQPRDFVEALRRRGVIVSPGEAFASDPATPVRAVRVCLGAAASRPELERALRTIADTLQGDAAVAPPSH